MKIIISLFLIGLVSANPLSQNRPETSAENNDAKNDDGLTKYNYDDGTDEVGYQFAKREASELTGPLDEPLVWGARLEQPSDLESGKQGHKVDWALSASSESVNNNKKLYSNDAQDVIEQKKEEYVPPSPSSPESVKQSPSYDPYQSILPAVLTGKRRLGEGDSPVLSAPSTDGQVKSPEKTVDNDTKLTSTPSSVPVKNVPQHVYTEDQFPSVITIKGREYLVIPHKANTASSQVAQTQSHLQSAQPSYFAQASPVQSAHGQQQSNVASNSFFSYYPVFQTTPSVRVVGSQASGYLVPGQSQASPVQSNQASFVANEPVQRPIQVQYPYHQQAPSFGPAESSFVVSNSFSNLGGFSGQYPVQQAPQHVSQAPVESYERPYPVQASQPGSAVNFGQYPIQQSPSFGPAESSFFVSNSISNFGGFSGQHPIQQAPQSVNQLPVGYPVQASPAVQKFESVNQPQQQQQFQSQSPNFFKAFNDQRPSFISDPSFSPQIGQLDDSSVDVNQQQSAKPMPESNLHAPPQVSPWELPVSTPTYKPVSKSPTVSAPINTPHEMSSWGLPSHPAPVPSTKLGPTYVGAPLEMSSWGLSSAHVPTSNHESGYKPHNVPAHVNFPLEMSSWGLSSFPVGNEHHPVSTPSIKPASELSPVSVTVDTKVNSQVQPNDSQSATQSSSPSVSAGSFSSEATQAVDQSTKEQQPSKVSVAETTKGQSNGPQQFGYYQYPGNSAPAFAPLPAYAHSPVSVPSWSQGHFSHPGHPFVRHPTQPVLNAQHAQSAPQFVSQGYYQSPVYSPFSQTSQQTDYPYNYQKSLDFTPTRSFSVQTVHTKA